MLFSIIVPIYNVEKYLRECIESILCQEFSDFELILVDDGSPDTCGSICDEYAKEDERVIVIHKTNGGLVSARKTGIEASTGSYIVNVDGDDYVACDLLSHMACIIQEYNPDVIAYSCEHFSPNSSRRIINKCNSGLFVGTELNRLKSGIIYDRTQYSCNYGVLLYSIWSKAIKREVALEFQRSVPTNLTKGEDLAVVAPLIQSCSSLYVTDYYGYYYRNTSQSMINQFSINEFSNLSLTFDYLNSVMKCEYKNNINVYIYTMCRNYILSASRAVDSYKDFREIIMGTIYSRYLIRIKSAKIYRPSLQDAILKFLINHKWILPIWNRYHKK